MQFACGHGPTDRGVAFVGRVHQQDELVGLQAARVQVQGFVVVEPVNGGPVHRQPAQTGVQLVEIGLLALEVLHLDAQGVRLEAGVDVLGDEDHPLALAEQAEGGGNDAVVRDVEVDAGAAALLPLHGDQHRAAVRGGHAPAQAALAAQTVQGADHPAGVAAEFVVVLLELVQLLDHRHRQDHGVVGEAGDGVAVVQEHVGVEDEEFAGHDPPRSRWAGRG